MELPRQKGFYDSRRQFQGQDGPRPDAGSPPIDTAPPRGQLLAGGFLLMLIVAAFLKFAAPPKPMAAPAPTARQASGPAAAPAAH